MFSVTNTKSKTMVELEEVECCLLCGNETLVFRFQNQDRLYHLPGKFGMVECSQCGLLMLSPRPKSDEIGRYYPEDYGAYVEPDQRHLMSVGGLRAKIKEIVRGSVLSTLGYGTESISLFQRLLRPFARRRYFLAATYGYGDRFPQFVPGGNALEVGCGNGVFLSVLKKHGWKVCGVDLSTQAAEMAKKVFDIDVWVGQIEDAGIPAESFDYIHLSHVVEHFYDPMRAIVSISKLLKPGGILYMEVPNAAGIRAKLSGSYWYGWDAPRHVVMFSPKTSRELLEACGLKVKKLSTGLSDTSAWEVVYEDEEKKSRTRPDRPSLDTIEKLEAERRSLQVQTEFANDPFGGDFIACWAVKGARRPD